MKPAVLALLLTTGCATAHLAGQVPVTAPDPGHERVVVVEPFFETAEWKTTVKTEIATVMGGSPGVGISVGIGSPFAQDVAVQHTVSEKPLFAKVAVLAEEHRQVLAEIQRLRPNWRVTSTSGAEVLSGPVTLVRVIVGDAELVESNRAMKNLAFGFGLLIWPLLLATITPVEETQRVYGVLDRYILDAAELKSRLVRYPTQPDFAVNAINLPADEREFGLDLTYQEGLLANEGPRENVLIRGFSLKLASAIVALVEEP
jgi:hypothetical protein